jgi:hypothetical protein
MSTRRPLLAPAARGRKAERGHLASRAREGRPRAPRGPRSSLSRAGGAACRSGRAALICSCRKPRAFARGVFVRAERPIISIP